MFENFKKDEERIIQEVKKGNLDAINQVFKRHYPDLVKHAHVLIRDKSEAEDIVQECFANILSKPFLWNNIIDLRWYLGRSVHNLCVYHLRTRNASRQKHQEYSIFMETQNHTPAPEVLRSYERQENESTVRELLSLLAPRGHQAIKLVYFEGLSYAEASTALGISKNSLKTHMRIAMAVMRRVLQVWVYIILFRLIY